MNRRVAILIAIIGLNLMACCCGGAGNAPKPVVAQAPKTPEELDAEVEAKAAAAKEAERAAKNRAEMDEIFAKEAKEAATKSIPKVTRANYNKVKNGMSFDEVNEILGKNSKEHSRVGNSAGVVSWSNPGVRFGCIVTITFSKGVVFSKAIIGD